MQSLNYLGSNEIRIMQGKWKSHDDTKTAKATNQPVISSKNDKYLRQKTWKYSCFSSVQKQQGVCLTAALDSPSRPAVWCVYASEVADTVVRGGWTEAKTYKQFYV